MVEIGDMKQDENGPMPKVLVTGGCGHIGSHTLTVARGVATMILTLPKYHALSEEPVKEVCPAIVETVAFPRQSTTVRSVNSRS
jgi:nucleoside-diphosphate-sugar epimerase